LGWSKVLKANKSDFIWSLEHDNLPAVNCLENLLLAWESEHLDYRIGVLQPIERGGYDLSKFNYYKLKGLKLNRIRNYAASEKPTKGFGTSFNGSLILCDMLKEIGLLREDFFVGLEDSDLSQRINKHGYSVIKVPSALVYHDLLKNARFVSIGNHKIILSSVSTSRRYYVLRNSLFMARKKLYLNDSRNRWAMFFFLLRLPFQVSLDLLTNIKGYRIVACRLVAFRDALIGKMGKQYYWFMN
jgi:GT2 family glycosyltransferase